MNINKKNLLQTLFGVFIFVFFIFAFSNNVKAQTGSLTVGSACTIANSNDPCQNSGMSCVNGFCALPGGGGTGAGTGGGAAGVCPDASLTMTNGICLPKNSNGGLAGATSLTSLILKVIQILLAFSGMVAIVVLIVGGFWYITSAGNEETAEKGKKAIINAIIGLVVVILSYTIVTVLVSVINGTDRNITANGSTN